MLLYLDSFRSEPGNPNENQGRELLELHTVGREAGYTEAMVKSSSVILSGWTVDYAAHLRRVVQPGEAHDRRESPCSASPRPNRHPGRPDP